MASTRSELRTRVEGVTKRTDKETVINDALDMGLSEIALRHNWRELTSVESLSASEDDTSEDLTSGTHHVISARVIDGTHSYKLRILPRTQFHRWFPNVSEASASKPMYAWVDDTTIYFSSPLSGDLTIDVQSYILPAFTDDDTECPISVAENALSFWTISFLYDALEMFIAASKWDRRYELALARAILSDASTPATEFVAEGFHGMSTVEDENAWINWTPDSLSV